MFNIGIFLPLSPVQRVAAGLGRATTPLLKEKSDVLRLTLIAQFTQPLYFDRTRSWSALSSCDYPMNIRNPPSQARRAMVRMKQSALRRWSVSSAAGASWPQRFRWRHRARYVAERIGPHSVDGQNRASANCAWSALDRCANPHVPSCQIRDGYTGVGMSLWNRSLIELTKMSCGRRQCLGCSRRSGRSVRSKPVSKGLPLTPRKRSDNRSA